MTMGLVDEDAMHGKAMAPRCLLTRIRALYQSRTPERPALFQYRGVFGKMGCYRQMRR
ncbi:hypothetical protein [Paraburkholderia caledonica]|uniref:hypothetical protein n=1 Tax=Paraburkholderia caledonica TaxID=134536 RepID=UPI0013DEAE9C|nr:hypothetical protein [Paraburkholderia caledonica]